MQGRNTGIQVRVFEMNYRDLLVFIPYDFHFLNFIDSAVAP
jgi:hypothetical protein